MPILSIPPAQSGLCLPNELLLLVGKVLPHRDLAAARQACKQLLAPMSENLARTPMALFLSAIRLAKVWDVFEVELDFARLRDATLWSSVTVEEERWAARPNGQSFLGVVSPIDERPLFCLESTPSGKPAEIIVDYVSLDVFDHEWASLLLDEASLRSLAALFGGDAVQWHVRILEGSMDATAISQKAATLLVGLLKQVHLQKLALCFREPITRPSSPDAAVVAFPIVATLRAGGLFDGSAGLKELRLRSAHPVVNDHLVDTISFSDLERLVRAGAQQIFLGRGVFCLEDPRRPLCDFQQELHDFVHFLHGMRDEIVGRRFALKAYCEVFLPVDFPPGWFTYHSRPIKNEKGEVVCWEGIEVRLEEDTRSGAVLEVKVGYQILQ